MSSGVVIGSAILYLLGLFLIAYLANRRSERLNSWVKHPAIYALSLAVFCTAWTFYGSVGRAATNGLSFLPVYLGPTILAPIWLLILRKIILISKTQRINSVADFISSRYAKSTLLGGLVAIITVFGITPYISIQLKAIVTSFSILIPHQIGSISSENPILEDPALYITIFLAAFVIFFGTRFLDPNERHEGIVAAIAFESLFKLTAFLAVGAFVCFGLFSNPSDLFEQGLARPDIQRLLSFSETGIDAWEWFWLNLLSMLAILFLPRQFHVGVVENYDRRHVQTAAWLFPLYLLLINIFVIPIAIAGLLLLGDQGVEPDFFVLELPMKFGQDALALFVALGGFSAATGMIIVSTLALSIMIGNNLVLPLVVRQEARTEEVRNLPKRFIRIRRLSIGLVLLLAYGYLHFIGTNYSIVSTGLISFSAVAQFAPAVIGGLYWRHANRWGALAGLTSGFLLWAYTLPLPTLVETGLIDGSWLSEGPWGISWLKPTALLGMPSASIISSSAFWSLSINTFAFVGVSLLTKTSQLGISQADLFVGIYKYRKMGSELEVRRRRARTADLQNVLERFLGVARARILFRQYERQRGVDLSVQRIAAADLIDYTETQLAGAIGTASASLVIDSIAKEEPISLEELFRVLDQTQEMLQYSRILERKSNELEVTTQQLKSANQQLQQLDQLKAEFITTVTHELRTPLTSIRSLSEILLHSQNVSETQRAEFLTIMVSECTRLTRLINQVLNLEKIQQPEKQETLSRVDLSKSITDTVASLFPQKSDSTINLQLQLPTAPVELNADTDQLRQLWTNLLENARKFCRPESGEIEVTLHTQADWAVVQISDNGPGIPLDKRHIIFERFTQLSTTQQGKPQGSGLGLHISQKIVEQHHGTIQLVDRPGWGACFEVRLPLPAMEKV